MNLFRELCSSFAGLDELRSWHDPEDRGRDACLDALKMIDEALKRPEKQYGMCTEPQVSYSPLVRWLSGHMEVLSLGMHPAYWKNGCGHELANWCAELADIDKVPLCASVSPMGARVCESFGFVEKELVTIKGHIYHPGDITISFQQRAVPGMAISASRRWKRPETSLWRTRPRLCATVFLVLQGLSTGDKAFVTAKRRRETVILVDVALWSADCAQVGPVPCLLRLTSVATWGITQQ